MERVGRRCDWLQTPDQTRVNGRADYETTKLVLDLTVPPGVVTDIGPDVAPVGTGTTIFVAASLVGFAVVPLNSTVAPPRFVPVIVTTAPIGPAAGENAVIVGPTTKLDFVVAVPPAVVIVIGPVIAPAGTATVILVAVSLVGVAAVPLNFTVAVARFVPVMVTMAPIGPAAGENAVIVGATTKLVAVVAVPTALVTEMGPVVAPAETGTTIAVAVSLVVLATVPLNLTVAPARFVPVIVTEVPTVPLVGVKPAIAGLTVKLEAVVTVPAAVVTEIGPVVAPTGTATVIVDAVSVAGFAVVPLNDTVADPRLVPVIVTTVPTGPLWGEKPVTANSGGKPSENRNTIP